MYNRKGLTLMEILLVLLIVLAIILLILPILAQARKQAKRAVCVENMRQVYTAWKIYLDDYGFSEYEPKNYPFMRMLKPYIKHPSTLICPTDPLDGWWQNFTHVKTSYALIDIVAEDILKRDQNFGVVACALHGQCRYTSGMLHPRCKGLVLRIRLDGSLGRGYYLLICMPDGGFGWEVWYYFTDAPIPLEYLLPGSRPCDPVEW